MNIYEYFSKYPASFLFFLLCAIATYSNLAWMYMHLVSRYRGMRASQIVLPRLFHNPQASHTPLFFYGAVWPLSLALSVTYWIIWLTLGGVAKMLTGEKSWLTVVTSSRRA